MTNTTNTTNQTAFDFKFEHDKSFGGGYWSAKLTMSNGEPVTIAIFHDSGEGSGWQTYISIHAPKSNDYEYQCKLYRGNERTDIIDGFAYYDIEITPKELSAITERIVNLVKETFPKTSARESYFGH